MSIFKFLGTSLVVSLCAVASFAQMGKVHPVGKVSDFKSQLKTQGSTLRGKKNAVLLPLGDGKQLSGTELINTALLTDSIVIGNVDGETPSLFKLYLSDTSVRGLILLQEKKQAFEYFTEAGITKVKEVDINTKICIDYKLPETVAKASTGPVVAAAPPAGNAVYNLQSFPGAAAVVKLDFDGQYVTGTDWNAYYNNNQPIDALPTNFTVDQIRQIWEGVAEDFRPFNINITTSETVYQAAAANRRMRTIFTPSAFLIAGGVAMIGSFTQGGDLAPCWVFTDDIYYTTNAASHEIGHTLGLAHDGLTGYENYQEYYQGDGMWGPIMGNPTFGVVQWSQGEYSNANNQEDDRLIITTNNGFGYRNDEDLNTTASARTITPDGTGNVSAFSNGGIISKMSDKDLFKIVVTDQTALDLTVRPLVPRSDFTVVANPNLNISARLLNSAGTALKTFNPTGTLDAKLDKVPVSTGTYYLEIDGVGDGLPTTGYSDYGSLGGYSISGSIKGCKNNFEPNASVAAAIAFPINSTLNASITSSTDNDYYKLTVTNTWDINLSLLDLTANADLQLLNSAGTVVATSANSGNTNEFISYLAPAAGTYYVRVFGNGGAVTTSCYTLSNTLQQNGCIAEAGSGNNSIATATGFPLRSSIQGAINTTSDQDYYKFSFTSAASLTLKLSNVFVDLDMQLVNASGTQLAISQATGQSEENISFSITNAGTYYVKIFGKSGANFRRCYTLTNNAVFPCANAYEPNNDPFTPPAIPLNSTISADLSDIRDGDFYSITTTSSGRINITYSNISSGSYLRLFDTNQKLVAENKAFSNANKTLSYLLPAAGTYYIGVGIFDQYTAPNFTCYNLSNSFLPCSNRTNITSGSSFCPYQPEVTFSVPATSGSTYKWIFPDIVVGVSGTNTNAVTANINGTYPGTYNVQVIESTASSCYSSVKSITVLDQTSGTCNTNYPKRFSLEFGINNTERVTIPYKSIFNVGTDGFTIEAKGSVVDKGSFFNSTNATSNTGIDFGIGNDGSNEWLYVKINGTLYNSDYIVNNNCSSYAVTRYGANISFYLGYDAIPLRSGTDAFSIQNVNNTNNIVLGYTPASATSIDGKLNFVRYWRIGRTGPEITNVHQNYFYQTAVENVDLIGNWTFHESGQKVYDVSAYNNHGYLGTNATATDAADPIRNAAGATNPCYDPQFRKAADDALTGETTENTIAVIFHPNPFENNGQLIIQGTTGRIFSVQIIDLNARVIHAAQVVENENYQLPEGLVSGMYFIQVTGEDFSKTIKVVKHLR